MKRMRYKLVLLLSLLSLPAMLLVATGGPAAAAPQTSAASARTARLPHQASGHSSQPSPARRPLDAASTARC